MPFKKGHSGNPGGRAIAKTKDGRTLNELAREHTAKAVNTLVEVMNDKGQPGSARVAAADKILNRGWGQAPQSLTLKDERQPIDLSELTNEQLEAIESLRTLTDRPG